MYRPELLSLPRYFGKPPVLCDMDMPLSYDDDLGVQIPYVVEGFKGQTACHCPIAYDRYDLVIISGNIPGSSHPQRHRDGRAAVARIKGIKRTFGLFRKAAHTSHLTQRVEVVGTACQYLVDICLMTYVPYHFVLRSVKNPVDGDGKLYSAQIRRQMTSRPGHLIHEKIPYLISQKLQLVVAHVLQIAGKRKAVQIIAHVCCTSSMSIYLLQPGLSPT